MLNLEFCNQEINLIVESVSDESTLIVADSFNYFRLNNKERCVLVYDSNTIPVINFDYDKVVAVGGCTSLDVGRFLAIGKEIILIPTILSTSCISVDRSVIKHRLFKTPIPKKVIVSLLDVMNSPIKWNQSGLADLFSNISASIDFQSRSKNFSYEDIRNNVNLTFDALDDSIHFKENDESSIIKLAYYLHQSSCSVIERGDTKLSAAGEHDFYHKIVQQQSYCVSTGPTHGQIVSIGTLISSLIYAELEGDYRIFKQLYTAYHNLDLPLSSSDLRNIGIYPEHIVLALKSIDTHSYIGRYISKKGMSSCLNPFGFCL